MKFGRNVALPAAVAGMLCSPFALLSHAAQADELSDLQEKNQALQQRIDQLAQAIPGAGGFYTQGSPPAPTAGAGLVGGSFPRSFLIPGTDTSLRVGGEVRTNVLYFFNGGSPNTAPSTTNVLNNGQLNSTPFNFHNTVSAAGVFSPASNPARSRDNSTFIISPQQTKFNIETRTPTAYGEARTFVELDFAGGSAFSPGGVNQLSSTNSLTPRLRYAYGTLGGFLAGQANSNFSDPDADPPQLEFGGQVGNPGVTRIPQVRYTQPLQPYGLLGALSFSVEMPETDAWTAGQAINATDIGAVTTSANPALTCPVTTVAGVATVATCSVTGNLPAVIATKSPAPDLTAAWYIPQPWGHLDLSLVYRPELQLRDGLFVDKSLSGFAGHIGGDVKPGWFGWAKDDITFHMLGGENIGRYLGGNTSMFSVVSNYPAIAPTTAAAAQAVVLKSSMAFGANASYTHWWTDIIRSYVAGGIQHHDIPVNLRTVAGGATPGSTGVSPVCASGPGGGPSNAQVQGLGGCGLNKELVSASVGTIWSPVAFVDFGVEYSYGHRQAVSNVKGDVNAITGRATFRF